MHTLDRILSGAAVNIVDVWQIVILFDGWDSMIWCACVKKKTYVILCSGLRSRFGLISFAASCLFYLLSLILLWFCFVCCCCVCFCLEAFVVRPRGLQSFYAGCHWHFARRTGFDCCISSTPVAIIWEAQTICIRSHDWGLRTFRFWFGVLRLEQLESWHVARGCAYACMYVCVYVCLCVCM